MEERRITFDAIPALMHEMTVRLLDLNGRIGRLEEEISNLKELIEKAPASTRRKPVDIDRAAEITGKSKHTLYRYTAQGLIPCYKRGRTIYFFEDELDDWIRRGRIEELETAYAGLDCPIVPLPTPKKPQ